MSWATRASSGTMSRGTSPSTEGDRAQSRCPPTHLFKLRSSRCEVELDGPPLYFLLRREVVVSLVVSFTVTDRHPRHPLPSRPPPRHSPSPRQPPFGRDPHFFAERRGLRLWPVDYVFAVVLARENKSTEMCRYVENSWIPLRLKEQEDTNNSLYVRPLHFC